MHTNSNDILRCGSVGASVSIVKGVTTEVVVEKPIADKLEIFINGKTDSATVTRSVVKNMIEMRKGFGNLSIRINHESDVPIGCGMGASGAGAWGSAIALDKLLGIGLTRDEAGQVAHRAEVENKTGLGTVLTQRNGGIGIRTKAGAPGIGLVEQIPFDDDLRVVCSSVGPISTKDMLSDPEVTARINKLGGRFVRKLSSDASAENFMRLSRKFVEQTHLLTESVQDGLYMLDSNGFHNASMALFGETVFALVNKYESNHVISILKKWNNRGKTFSSSIDTVGARLLK